MTESKDVRRVACWFCEEPCRLIATCEDGKIVKVEEDPDITTIPYFKGGVEGCPKLKHFKEYLYHPDRLTYPMKRVGERGSGEWERISWDQALKEIGEKLCALRDEYGAESVAAMNGTYRTEQWARFRFLNYFGTPNNVHMGHDCFCVNSVLQAATQGWFDFAFPIPGSGHGKVAVQWGHNPPFGWEKEWPSYLNRDKETKMITIDPVYTEAARNSDVYARIRPGTDGALAMCMIRTLLFEDTFDHEFVENWTNAPFLIDAETKKLIREERLIEGGENGNFVAWNKTTNKPTVWNSALMEYNDGATSEDIALFGTFDLPIADGTTIKAMTVIQGLKDAVEEWTFEKTSEVTWIPVETVEEVAHLFAWGGRETLIPWGLATNSNGKNTTYIELAKIILRTLVGSLDAPGGHYMGYANPNYLNDNSFEDNHVLSPEQKKKQIGVDTYPLMSWETCDNILKAEERVLGWRTMCMTESTLGHPRALWNAIIDEDPYPIKAVLVQADNPLMALCDTTKIFEALTSPNLELLVVHDFFMTPTAMLADYVLPAATSFERDNWMSHGGNTDYVWGSEAGPMPEDWECRDDFSFWYGLGCATGQEENWPWKTMREACDYRAQSGGYKDFMDFMNGPQHGAEFPEPEYYQYKEINPKTGKPFGFATVSGKVEIAPSILDNLGLVGIPEYIEPAESPYNSPDLMEKYPYILTTGARSLNFPFKHTEHRQVPGLRKQQPYPVCMVNPVEAARIGVGDGSWVKVSNMRGSIMMMLKTNESLDPRVVSIAHGWWYPELPAKLPELGGYNISNANVLTTDDYGYCDAFSGSYPYKVSICNVEPGEKPEGIGLEYL